MPRLFQAEEIHIWRRVQEFISFSCGRSRSCNIAPTLDAGVFTRVLARIQAALLSSLNSISRRISAHSATLGFDLQSRRPAEAGSQKGTDIHA